MPKRETEQKNELCQYWMQDYICNQWEPTDYHCTKWWWTVQHLFIAILFYLIFVQQKPHHCLNWNHHHWLGIHLFIYFCLILFCFLFICCLFIFFSSLLSSTFSFVTFCLTEREKKLFCKLFVNCFFFFTASSEKKRFTDREKIGEKIEYNIKSNSPLRNIQFLKRTQWKKFHSWNVLCFRFFKNQAAQRDTTAGEPFVYRTAFELMAPHRYHQQIHRHFSTVRNIIGSGGWVSMRSVHRHFLLF